MAIDLENSRMTDLNGIGQPELLVSSALHLMSHYSASAGQVAPCLKLASVIERHLRALAGHGDLNPVLRATCQQLSEQWAAVVDDAMPRPPRQSLFERLVRSH
ncbi:hypothetical protein [Massilia sp. CF038]|jgi:hypothetical protein|uniref:hypothetical protein n=1 Tax=Massilia sp. CF038 TaxID=1881045 RepID=UPI0009153837|nr:hypothetical protein [Massilia sp. CF038]SHH13328.1 hypothetical protein SAMN05428948_2950 [Massilia sp. CF038]